MTTETKHEATATETTVDLDVSEDVPETANDETAAHRVDDEATELLAKARYDAFRLVTEARKEAETILGDAREEAAAIRREAEFTAESILDAARVQADEIRSSTPRDDADDGDVTEEAVAELEAEHQQLTDQVGSLRELADQLEQRFAALAAQAEAPVAAPQPPVHAEPAASDASSGPSGPVLDYSPSVPTPSRAEALAGDAEEAEDEEERGSFYSRRSAKLPRIGEAGGKSALDMMRSIRETFEDQ